MYQKEQNEPVPKTDFLKNRQYECKLCHKMNKHSYICHDCRNALQGISKANGKTSKRRPKKCMDCGCTIVRRGLTAKRCRDCTTVNNQLRYRLYKKIEFLNYKINQLELSKELGMGAKRRLENLIISRQHLMGRIKATYV